MGRRGVWGRGVSWAATGLALAAGVACGSSGNETSPAADAGDASTRADAPADGTIDQGGTSDGHAGADASDSGDGALTDGAPTDGAPTDGAPTDGALADGAASDAEAGHDAQPSSDGGIVAGEWTWENGVLGQGNDVPPVYDAGVNDTPGARMGSATWTNPGTTLWLFGGFVSLQPAFPLVSGYLNDLWRYDSGHWTWVSGSSQFNQPGVYGNLGDAAATSVPGSRFDAITWVDGSGNVFVFGGQGYDSKGTFGLLDDVWQYGGGQWTWVAGSNVVNQPGTYGTKGTPSPNNFPGARVTPGAWVDSAGDFWLFGGTGYGQTAGSQGVLNDLWRFHAGQWTWMAGSNAPGQLGSYGVQGTPSPDNTPGARDGATAWADKTGAFWVFGGVGYSGDAAAGPGGLNDLWRYSGGQWTFMAGSATIRQPGSYGSLGVSSSGNTPGARAGALGWVGPTGALWLFGGALEGGGLGSIDDLWKYESGAWTWMGGPTTVNGPGVYTTPGTPSSNELPAARDTSMTWTDGAGAFWLYGGSYDAPGVLMGDMWKFVPN
jgi:N-acetylneuraminic acid mutarotase